MKILVVGGGSGGHITPVVAVVREILEARPRAKVAFWTDFKYYRNVTKLCSEIGVSWVDGHEQPRTSSAIRVHRLPAGKFHRYSGWTVRTYFEHPILVLKDLIFGNFCGFLGFLAGLITSFFRLLPRRSRPNVVFLKGGYVCLPVGLVARLFKIPYVIHESDAVAGLANRLLMKHAARVAFGTPPPDEVLATHPNYVYAGIPVGTEFRPVTPARQRALKKSLSFNPDRPLVVITGGSQGAENLNLATHAILPKLLKFTSVALVAGHRYYEDVVDLKQYEQWDHASLESNFRLWEFNTAMHELLGGADVVVSRAGATTIAELASLEKAVILVPFEFLPSSHQLRNAERLESAGATLVVKDATALQHPDALLDTIRHLVRSPRERTILAKKLHSEARADAARILANLIISEVR